MIRRLLGVLRSLSPNCREAAQLISESSGRKLSAAERGGLNTHLCLCRSCRAYGRTVRTLGELVRNVDGAPHEPSAEALPDAARESILGKIQRP